MYVNKHEIVLGLEKYLNKAIKNEEGMIALIDIVKINGNYYMKGLQENDKEVFEKTGIVAKIIYCDLEYLKQAELARVGEYHSEANILEAVREYTKTLLKDSKEPSIPKEWKCDVYYVPYDSTTLAEQNTEEALGEYWIGELGEPCPEAQALYLGRCDEHMIWKFYEKDYFYNYILEQAYPEYLAMVLEKERYL